MSPAPARHPAAAAQLAALGVTPLNGDLEDGLYAIVAEVAKRDVVIYSAQTSAEVERRAIGALIDALAGSHERLLSTSGTGVFVQKTEGGWSEDCFAEDDPFEVEPLAVGRVEVEVLVRSSVRSS